MRGDSKSEVIHVREDCERSRLGKKTGTSSGEHRTCTQLDQNIDGIPRKCVGFSISSRLKVEVEPSCLMAVCKKMHW